jgi:hypothetical protein
MSTPRTSTPTIIAAMRALARDIESPDGVANAAILEAADRLDKVNHLLRCAQTVENLRDEPSWPGWLRSAVDEAIK